jgi:hypothetical protein
LTENLNEIDGKSHCGLHEKELRSFNNIKLRWEKIHESGDTRGFYQWKPTRGQKEIIDRHYGFMGLP